MQYYDTILAKIADIVGEAGEVKSVSERSVDRNLYYISVTFTYPWTDPIGIESYYQQIADLARERDGKIRLTAEPSTSAPGKTFAKITVAYKVVDL